MDLKFSTNDEPEARPKVAFKVSYGGQITQPNSRADFEENYTTIDEVLKKNDRQTLVDELVQKHKIEEKF